MNEPKGYVRRSIAMAVVSGATHFLALLFALMLFATGSFVLIVNVKTLTIPLLVAVLIMYAVALLIAIPSEAQKAIVFLVPYLPDAIVGGRRKHDPPTDTAP